MGRLWQTVILKEWKEVFAWLPVESLIKEDFEDIIIINDGSDKEYDEIFDNSAAENAVAAVKNLDITPSFSPIRGGTDGSRLTEIGILTPNVFTGGHNFHSRSEWASLEQMEAASKTIIELVKLWSKA